MMTTNEANELAKKLKDSAEYLMVNWEQFNYCQAWIGDISPRYSLIKSYFTIVGLVDHEEKVVYELGKWTRTTSKQVTQICNQVYRSYTAVRYGR